MAIDFEPIYRYFGKCDNCGATLDYDIENQDFEPDDALRTAIDAYGWHHDPTRDDEENLICDECYSRMKIENAPTST